MTKPHLVLKSHLNNGTESAQRLPGRCFWPKKMFVLLSWLSQEDPAERMFLPKDVPSRCSWNDPLCKLRETWSVTCKTLLCLYVFRDDDLFYSKMNAVFTHFLAWL